MPREAECHAYRGIAIPCFTSANLGLSGVQLPGNAMAWLQHAECEVRFFEGMERGAHLELTACIGLYPASFATVSLLQFATTTTNVQHTSTVHATAVQRGWIGKEPQILDLLLSDSRFQKHLKLVQRLARHRPSNISRNRPWRYNFSRYYALLGSSTSREQGYTGPRVIVIERRGATT